MKPVAYCDLSFLDAVSANTTVDLMDPNGQAVARTKAALFDLLFNGLIIHTNASVEDIEKRAENNPLIRRLKNSQSLKPGLSCMPEIQTDSKSFFLKPGGHSLLLLSDMYAAMKAIWQGQSGCHISTSQSDHSVLFTERVEDFDPTVSKRWDFLQTLLTPHHSIVIADPYIYKETTLKNLAAMLEQVGSWSLSRDYTITIIGSNKRRNLDLTEDEVIKNVQRHLRQPLEKIKTGVRIETFFCNREASHDREIYTNNICIFSGAGVDAIDLKGKVSKASTWLAFSPFQKITGANGAQGFCYKLMSEKLARMTRWIADQSPSQNPLLNSPFFSGTK